MSKDTKSQPCARCGEVVSLLDSVATLMTSNARITTELASLHAALAQLAVVQSSAHTTGTTSELPRNKPITPISDGSGAGSVEVYKEMIKRNWHGRLGRTHMMEVDRMLESGREELDNYLHRTINEMFPVGGSYRNFYSDTIFATLSAFGLRLEDRGPLADGIFFTDPTVAKKPTITRLYNYSAYYYTASTEKLGDYWKASAMETVTELARYRGLFTAEGLLKAVKQPFRVEKALGFFHIVVPPLASFVPGIFPLETTTSLGSGGG